MIPESEWNRRSQDVARIIDADINVGVLGPCGRDALANVAPKCRSFEVGTWWSPKDDLRTGFSMRVVSCDGTRVLLEAPLWNGHVLSWETTVADLLERWVRVE